MTDKPTPPSEEVKQEEHVRTIKHKFKTEVAELLASDLFKGMADHLEKNEEILNYIDMIDCSVSIIDSLIKQQVAIARQSEAAEIFDHVTATWANKLLEILNTIEKERNVKEK